MLDTLNGGCGGRLLPAAPVKETTERVLRIRCEDPAFLLSLFADQHLYARIVATASGSRREPRLSARQIRELEVPWPNENERHRVLQQMKGIEPALANFVNGEDDFFGNYLGFFLAISSSPRHIA